MEKVRITKILNEWMAQIDGQMLKISGKTVGEYNLEDFSNAEQARIIEAAQRKKDLSKMREQARLNTEKKAATLKAAKWTIIIGHRSRCFKDWFGESVDYYNLTASAGTVVNVLSGGVDIQEQGDARRVYYATDLQEAAQVFDKTAQVSKDKIFTKNPRAIIGRRGITIKMLSKLAGVNLKVITQE